MDAGFDPCRIVKCDSEGSAVGGKGQTERLPERRCSAHQTQMDKKKVLIFIAVSRSRFTSTAVAHPNGHKKLRGGSGQHVCLIINIQQVILNNVPNLGIFHESDLEHM